jgi:glycerol-3-phosphate dehydrogenase (NAD(P)+)
MKEKITVLGGGAWGTAIASLLCRDGHDVLLWAMEEAVCSEVNNKCSNSRYLPDIELPKTLKSKSCLEKSFEHSKIIVEVVPVRHLRSVLEKAKPFVTPEHSFVTTSKGVEPETLMLPTQIVQDVLCAQKLAALGGPNFAKDVARGGFSATTIASNDDEFLKTLSVIFSSDNFKVESSRDLLGVQVCGLLKNVVSLAIGIARGAKLSENAIAYIFTKGLKEAAEITQAFGGKTETVYGLAGVGDLVLTSMGTQSRNLKAGVMIGSGRTLQDVENELGILPEGVASASALAQLVEKLGLYLPLAVTVEQILKGKALPADLL